MRQGLERDWPKEEEPGTKVSASLKSEVVPNGTPTVAEGVSEPYSLRVKRSQGSEEPPV